MDKHHRGKNKPKRNKDNWRWRRLTRIANDELEKFRLNFSRCTNRDEAPLTYHVVFLCVVQMGKQTMGTPAQALKHRSDNKLYRIQVFLGIGF